MKLVNYLHLILLEFDFFDIVTAMAGRFFGDF